MTQEIEDDYSAQTSSGGCRRSGRNVCQAMAVDFHGYARSGIGWTGTAVNNSVSRLPVLKVNTVLARM